MSLVGQDILTHSGTPDFKSSRFHRFIIIYIYITEFVSLMTYGLMTGLIGCISLSAFSRTYFINLLLFKVTCNNGDTTTDRY